MRKLIPLFILLGIVSINLWAQNVLDCIPVVKEVQNQINQVVVTGNNGSAIIVWQDNRAGNYNIYAQRVSNTGHMQWLDHETGKIVVSGPSNKINLSAVSDNDGGAIISWQDDRAGNNDIYSQWIGQDGSVQHSWPATGLLLCDDVSEQSAPKMARDEDGGAFVVWSDNRGGDYDIYFRHIAPAGLLDTDTNGKRVQLLAESLNQVNPAVSTDGDHGIIIAYEQYTTPGNNDIFAQRINDAGANLWDDGGIPACIAANNQRNPRLINDAIGSAIIVWEDFVNFTWDIYTQRVADNTIQWTANGVAIMALALDQINPVIVQAGQNSAIIVWEHYLSATDSNIYAQKIRGTTSGTLQWLATGVPVSTIHDSFQINPQAVPDGFGGVIVVYETAENYATNGYDIYAQRINQDGLYVGAGQPGGYVVCTWDTDQTKPMIAYSISAERNAIYAWQDKRNEMAAGLHDIYTLGVVDAIEYTLIVTSSPVDQDIFRDAAVTGWTTNGSFASADRATLIGNYTLEAAPFGNHWVPSSILVVEGDFTLANNYTYTIHFDLVPDTLPVELSSFTANLTTETFVNLTWVTESETELLGYRVYRNESQNLINAISITPIMIPATNTSSTHVYNILDTEVNGGQIYYYWLESIDVGSTTFHGPVNVFVVNEVPPLLPETTNMGNAYPNPFRQSSSTNINVSVKAGEQGVVTIYNILGQSIQTFAVNEGMNPISWNGRDSKNKLCSSGIYFYRLQTPSMNQTKKMVLSK